MFDPGHEKGFEMTNLNVTIGYHSIPVFKTLKWKTYQDIADIIATLIIKLPILLEVLVSIKTPILRQCHISDILILLTAVHPDMSNMLIRKHNNQVHDDDIGNDDDKSKGRLDWQPCPWWRVFPF